MKKYVIELDGKQETIEAENYETAIKFALYWAGIVITELKD